MHASLEQRRVRPGTRAKTCFAIIVEFEIGDSAYSEFLHLVKENAAASVCDEPGCRRFDVLSPESETTRGSVLLYEIYDDRAAFEAHLATGHYASFDRITEPMILRKTVRHFDLHGDT